MKCHRAMSSVVTGLIASLCFARAEAAEVFVAPPEQEPTVISLPIGQSRDIVLELELGPSEDASVFQAAFALEFFPAGASGPVAVVPDAPQHPSPTARAVSELGGGSGVAIVYAGSLNPYQGVDLLIEGFRQAAFTDGEATLWVIGGESSAVARLRSTARYFS